MHLALAMLPKLALGLALPVERPTYVSIMACSRVILICCVTRDMQKSLVFVQ